MVSSKSSFVADYTSLIPSLRRTFLETVLGGKRNLKHISREIKRRKWIVQRLRRSRLIRRKYYVTDEDVLTVLLVAFTLALVLVLLLCVRALVSFFKHHRN